MGLRYYVPLIGLILLLSLLAYGLLHMHDETPTPLKNKPLPDFVLQGMDGGIAIDTAKLKGKPFILNFFASWCVTCRYEHPVFMQAAKEGKVDIYGINYKDTPQKLRKWLDKHGNPYMAIGIDKGDIALQMGLIGVPETFVISADGIILLRYAGAISERVLRQKIYPLLAL